MRRQKETPNILDMIPVRKYQWVEKDTVSVKVPRFRSRLGKKFCALLKKEPTYNVNLDKHCSFVWKLCDGKRTVREIGKSLSEKYGDEVEPVNQRLGELFHIMEANKLIMYKKVNNDSSKVGDLDNGDN
ncbi:MAG: PqqD family protein [Thermoplasmata archaeon]|nr:MAG: PqqD family protein [Thermoplasmata archaeon]